MLGIRAAEPYKHTHYIDVSYHFSISEDESDNEYDELP